MIKFYDTNKCLGYILPHALNLIPKRKYLYTLEVLQGENFVPNKVELRDFEGKVIPQNTIKYSVKNGSVILTIGNINYNRYRPCKIVLYSVNQGTRYSEPFFVSDLYSKEQKLVSWKCKESDVLQCVDLPISLIQDMPEVNSEVYKDLSTGNKVNVVSNTSVVYSLRTGLLATVLLTRLSIVLNSFYCYIGTDRVVLNEQPENYIVQGQENSGYILFHVTEYKGDKLDFDSYVVTEDLTNYVETEDNNLIITEK